MFLRFAAMFPDKSVPMFHHNNVPQCPDNSAPVFQDRSQERNVPQFLDSSVPQSQGNSVPQCPDNNVSMFHLRNVPMCQDNNVPVFQGSNVNRSQWNSVLLHREHMELAENNWKTIKRKYYQSHSFRALLSHIEHYYLNSIYIYLYKSISVIKC